MVRALAGTRTSGPTAVIRSLSITMTTRGIGWALMPSITMPVRMTSVEGCAWMRAESSAAAINSANVRAARFMWIPSRAFRPLSRSPALRELVEPARLLGHRLRQLLEDGIHLSCRSRISLRNCAGQRAESIVQRLGRERVGVRTGEPRQRRLDRVQLFARRLVAAGRGGT